MFLAVGLHKPHMPWNVPQKYYDMFPLAGIELPPYLKDDLADLPPAGVKMAKAEGDHKNIVESGRWKEAIQGYLAAIAYTDMNIGRLLDAFDKSRLQGQHHHLSSGATTAGTSARRITGASSRSGRKPPARRSSGSCPA